jgi:sugar O-acyltransferase (sialic acid O-acetyltransferase NeuD family)
MKKALFGCGGHAREIMAQMRMKLDCFVDDQYAVHGMKSIKDFNPEEYEIMISVADPESREKIAKKLPKNTKFFSFVHPTVLMMSDNIEIGEGGFIGAYSILTSNIKIGKHALLNRGVHVGHDCRIGDYFSAMPGSIVSGNVTIGNSVYLGTNASVREKISICDRVTVGLNSGVVKNIVQKGTYIGVPAIQKVL